MTGSGWADYCLTSSCGDVFALKPPRLVDTVCDTSVTPYADEPNWGICFLD